MKKTILIAFGVVVVVVVIVVMKQQGIVWHKAGGPVGAGRDTPIIIAGGSIHADSDTVLTAGWTVVPTDSTSYTAVIDPSVGATVRHIVVTDTADKEKNRIDIPNNVADDWRIEITEINTSSSAMPATPKAITISPDLFSDSSGRTLKITISKKPTSSARWDENLPAEIKFRGDPKDCQASSTAADPLDHCDMLSSIQVTLRGVAQTPVACETSPGDGKCKIKLKIAN